MKIYDVECTNHWEAGNMLTFRCPKCGDKIDVVVSGGWWSTKCSCGYIWHADIYAYTEDDESEDK
jgi:hypothetical protein